MKRTVKLYGLLCLNTRKLVEPCIRAERDVVARLASDLSKDGMLYQAVPITVTYNDQRPAERKGKGGAGKN